MRRIPNTYPGDITKYPTGRGTFPIGAADEGSKVLFYNETPVNLDLDFYNGNTDVLHAWEANFWVLDGEVGDITWSIDTDSLAVVNPPINAVFTTILNPNETLRDKAYPMPLIRQIGGQQAIVSSASQTINDGNALQQVIEATLQGHGSSDVVINNDGSYTLKGTGLLAAVGILTHILGTLTVDGILTAPGANVLGAAAVLTHILGTLTVDQAATLSSTLAVLGSSSLDNGGITTNGTGTMAAAAIKSNTFRDNTTGGDQLDLSSTGVKVNGNLTGPGASAFNIDSAGAGVIQFKQNGVNIAQIVSNGVLINSGAFRFLTGTMSRQTGNGNIACGSGTTITHGLGATPALVLATPNIAQAGSATVGIGNVTSTTFQCTVGAGTAVSFWCLAG